MNAEIAVKIAIGAVAMLAWGGLVLHGDAPAAPFVETLRYIVLGLGLFHATTTNTKEK